MNFGKIKNNDKSKLNEASVVQNETDDFYRKINGGKKQSARNIELCRCVYVCVCQHKKQ